MSVPSAPRIHLPPGWLPGCLVCWGIAGEQWAQALVAAALLAAAERSSARWALSVRHFERLSDLCAIAFAVIALYLFNSHGVLAIYSILLAFPWVLLPLCLAQVCATGDGVPLSALAMSRRVRDGTSTSFIDLRPVLGCVCLLSASAGALPTVAFAVGVGALLAALVMRNRGPAHALYRAASALLVAVALAVGLHAGLLRTQLVAADALQSLFTHLGLAPVPLDTAYTALGSLGRLKLSDRIHLRIESGRDVPLPLRLIEGRFQDFDNGIWRNAKVPATALDAVAGTRTWRIGESTPDRSMTVTVNRRAEIGALALPAGTVQITGADLLELQRHPSGGILAEARPGFLRYAAGYSTRGGTRSRDGAAPPAPAAADLAIPAGYQALFADIASRSGAAGRDAQAAHAAITRYFAEDFRYSLVMPGFHPGRLPLASFLTRTRAGHCEYFATATTLLLRQVGIPARYVVGYLVDEYSPLEGAFIARARHAHAWSEAFIDGAWVVVDTTPGQWLELESSAASRWHHVTDAIDWARLRLHRLQQAPPLPGPAALGLVPLLLAWLGWRLRHLARQRTPQTADVTSRTPTALAPLYTWLAARGHRPGIGEPPLAFLSRYWPSGGVYALRHLILRYYALRFGVAPVASHSLAEITRDAQALAAAQPASPTVAPRSVAPAAATRRWLGEVLPAVLGGRRRR